jgi:acyl-CoA dehydrogenase
MAAHDESGSVSAILLDQADRLFGQHATKAVLSAADEGIWPEALWRAVEEAGLTLALVPEEKGGVGLGAAETGLLVRRSAFHAVPIPLAETILAQALWTRAGGDALEGVVTLAPTNPRDRLTISRDQGGWRIEGRAERVPWGAQARHVLVLALDDAGRANLCLVPNPHPPHAEVLAKGQPRSTHDRGASFEAPLRGAPQDEVGRRGSGSLAILPARNVAYEPRPTLAFDGCVLPAESVRPAAGELDGSLMAEGAALRAQQMAGAMERCLDHALAYVNERVQFGRPLAKFQAIQHMLAIAAGQVAAATAAADALGEAAGTPGFGLAAAIAKARAGEAAGQVAAICHQVHGAMGFTQEHPLHFSTRRLFAWRDEFGGEAYWQARLGRLVCGLGGEALWPLVTGERPGA